MTWVKYCDVSLKIKYGSRTTLLHMRPHDLEARSRSVVEHVLSMLKDLGSIPDTIK
jgi:ribosomal protein S19E (S16A)